MQRIQALTWMLIVYEQSMDELAILCKLEIINFVTL